MNRKHFCLLPPFIRKFGMIPESYKIAMTYEEQLLWLCKYVEDLGLEVENIKTALTNIQEAIDTLEDEVENKQDKLIAGNNIFFDNEYIDAYLSEDLSPDIVSGSYIDLSGEIGSVVDLTPIQAPNTSYISLLVAPDEEYIIYGKCTFGKLNEDNELVSKFSFNPTESPFVKYRVLNDYGRLVVSWENTDEYTPFFYFSLSANYIYGKFKAIPDWVAEGGTSLVTSISEYSTDEEVPTAKAVYTAIGGGGSTSYNNLSDKPSINGVTLEGNLTTTQLNIDSITILEDDIFNVYNLDNGVYLMGDRNSTELWCGDKAVLLGDNYSVLFIFGTHNFMLISSSTRSGQLTPTEYPLLTSGSCTSLSSGTVYNYESNILSCWGIDTDLTDSGNSDYYVPSALAVKTYVAQEVGTIATALQTINTGSGV